MQFSAFYNLNGAWDNKMCEFVSLTCDMIEPCLLKLAAPFKGEEITYMQP